MSIFQTIIKAFIVGTERHPLPEKALAPLNISPSPDPAQTLMEALATTHLLKHAASLLAVAAPSATVPSSPADEATYCNDAAAKDLWFLLSGHHINALPEFVKLAAQNHLFVPPELLPELLERAARDANLVDKIRPVLGTRGEWLAHQNPEWSEVVREEEMDWLTNTFAERKKLLRLTRARNPLLALAWLEKTWSQETAGHKAQFVDILQVRLSATDEDLLERALLDKNREVRHAAAIVLMKLPESRFFSSTVHFFRERLASALSQDGGIADFFLKKTLPDLSEEAIAPWLALLPKDASDDWRVALFRCLLRLLPPAQLLLLSGQSCERVLDTLDRSNNADALLSSIVSHKDEQWTGAVLRRFTRDFRHALWRTKEMEAFLALFVEKAMVFFGQNNLVIEHDNQIALRAVEGHRQPWSINLLECLLEQYRRPAYGSGVIPGWHFASALQTAAYHCNPSEATHAALVRDYLQNPPRARPKEFETFLAIIRFRLKMREHLLLAGEQAEESKQ